MVKLAAKLGGSLGGTLVYFTRGLLNTVFNKYK